MCSRSAAAFMALTQQEDKGRENKRTQSDEETLDELKVTEREKAVN